MSYNIIFNFLTIIYFGIDRRGKKRVQILTWIIEIDFLHKLNNDFCQSGFWASSEQ